MNPPISSRPCSVSIQIKDPKEPVPESVRELIDFLLSYPDLVTVTGTSLATLEALGLSPQCRVARWSIVTDQNCLVHFRHGDYWINVFEPFCLHFKQALKQHNMRLPDNAYRLFVDLSQKYQAFLDSKGAYGKAMADVLKKYRP